MVKVTLATGETISKSWRRRPKYSRRSRLAREKQKRLLQEQQNICSQQQTLDSVDDATFETNLDTVTIITDPSLPSTSTSKSILEVTAIEEHIQFVSEEEYERYLRIFFSVMNFPLCIEKDNTPKPDRFQLPGVRLVDLGFVLNWAVNLQLNHTKICTFGQISLKKEFRDGLSSTLLFECNLCHRNYSRTTFDKNNGFNINEAAVWGTMAAGSTYGHTEEFLSLCNVPFMARSKFMRIETVLSQDWKDCLWESMEEAGKEERSQAILAKNICEDGVPYITVQVDGGWSKRSYGHSFNAKSGAAVIIGYYTQKILFIGVRNKYCSICANAEKKFTSAPEHTCYKNFTGSSTSMESSIIVEGFRLSEEMHGVRYTQFIGDGDSSVYAKLRESVTYGRDIRKFECTNHVVKCFGKALYKIANDTKFEAKARKLLNNKAIKRLEGAAKSAIAHNTSVEDLVGDLENGPPHTFGNHTNCKPYYCSGKIELDHTDYLKFSGLWQAINDSLNQVIRKASRLVMNQTNNQCESFMNILSRFNCGKRLNLISRGSFQTRCYLAALRFNFKVGWHTNAWRKRFGCDLGVITQSYIQRQASQAEKRTICREARPKTDRYANTISAPADTNYGPAAKDVELEGDELANECERVLKRLQVTETEIVNIEASTVGQFDNPAYLAARKDRLTASMFGRVLSLRAYTPCHNTVKEILYPKIFTSSDTNYGKDNERLAIKKFMDTTNITVTPSGLFVDSDFGFLGVSPDGLINDDGLVEVKCVPSLERRNVSLVDAAKNQKQFFLKMSGENLTLKRSHKYYFQVQGQLNICKRAYCYFIVFVSENKDLFIEKIMRDKTLWDETMAPKLCEFYRNCVVPETVLKRIPRQLRCKDPEYILEAIAAKEAKKHTQTVSRKRPRPV